MEKVHEQLCYKCHQRQVPGATVWLPWKFLDAAPTQKGKRGRYEPPLIVCDPCKPTASKEWSFTEGLVTAD